MDGWLIPIGIVFVGLVAVAVLVAGWGHRKRLVAMQRRLAWSEQSRFEAEQHAEAMEARMAEMHRTRRTRRTAAAAASTEAANAAALASAAKTSEPATPAKSGDQAERHATLGQALGRMPHGPRGPDDPAWVDTEPMVGSHVLAAYAPTMPADLELDLAPPTPSPLASPAPRPEQPA